MLYIRSRCFIWTIRLAALGTPFRCAIYLTVPFTVKMACSGYSTLRRYRAPSAICSAMPFVRYLHGAGPTTTALDRRKGERALSNTAHAGPIVLTCNKML
jgi:hypothetical protein